jgi:ATP-dependent exoDNAse (exonuclease V) beta subunit
MLTATNGAAAYLIARLRQMDVAASEEGGVPVADSEPVVTILALLRMADHPGDRISRYIVARTPAAALVGWSADAWTSDRDADRIAGFVRARLAGEGYGAVISEWTGALSAVAPPRDRARLRKLAELAFAWDRRPSLRPAEFVRHVEATRVEDPGTSAIRVLTIYKAKGLEFDAVVLPELDEVALTGEPGQPFLSLREDGTGPVGRIFPAIPMRLVPLFPEVREAVAQAREREVRDGLSALYVALTRPRHALYAVLKPLPESSSARTAARLLVRSLAPGRDGAPDDVVWEAGEREWWSDPVRAARLARPRASARRPFRPQDLRLATTARRRLLPHRAPSDLEGGEVLQLDRLLRPFPAGARDEGTAVHAWLESIEWLDDGSPDRAALLEIARDRVPVLGAAHELLDRFMGWIRRPAVAELLRHDSFPAGTTVEREVPFAARDGARILRGAVDRLVRIPAEEGSRLVVVDWKTDAIDAADEPAIAARTAYYGPQVEAYLRALSSAEGIPADRITGLIVFLRAGVVRDVALV